MSNERRRVLGESTYDPVKSGLFVKAANTKLKVSEDGLNWVDGCKVSVNVGLKYLVGNTMGYSKVDKCLMSMLSHGSTSSYGDYVLAAFSDSFTIDNLKDTSYTLSFNVKNNDNVSPYGPYSGYNDPSSSSYWDGGIFSITDEISVFSPSIEDYSGNSIARTYITDRSYTSPYDFMIRSSDQGGTAVGYYNKSLTIATLDTNSNLYFRKSTDNVSKRIDRFKGFILSIINDRLLFTDNKYTVSTGGTFNLYLSKKTLSSFSDYTNNDTSPIEYDVIDTAGYGGWTYQGYMDAPYLPVTGMGGNYLLKVSTDDFSTFYYSLYKVLTGSKSLELVKSNLFSYNGVYGVNKYNVTQYTIINNILYTCENEAINIYEGTKVTQGHGSGYRINPAFIPY